MVDIGASWLTGSGVVSGEGVATHLFVTALKFTAATARRFIPCLATVGDGDIHSITREDNDAVGIDPKHQHQQCTDGAVEYIIVVEVVDINLESP